MKIVITIETEEVDMPLSYFSSVLAEIIVEQTKQVMHNDTLQECSGSNCGHDWNLDIDPDHDDYEDSEPDELPEPPMMGQSY